MYLRFYFILGPGQFCYFGGPVRAAVVDDQHPVRMLAGAQDYADLFVVCGQDGGYGGQVGASGKWVRWLVLECIS